MWPKCFRPLNPLGPLESYPETPVPVPQDQILYFFFGPNSRSPRCPVGLNREGEPTARSGKQAHVDFRHLFPNNGFIQIYIYSGTLLGPLPVEAHKACQQEDGEESLLF